MPMKGGNTNDGEMQRSKELIYFSAVVQVVFGFVTMVSSFALSAFIQSKTAHRFEFWRVADRGEVVYCGVWVIASGVTGILQRTEADKTMMKYHLALSTAATLISAASGVVTLLYAGIYHKMMTTPDLVFMEFSIFVLVLIDFIACLSSAIMCYGALRQPEKRIVENKDSLMSFF